MFRLDGAQACGHYAGVGAQAAEQGVDLNVTWAVSQPGFNEKTYYLRQIGIGPVDSYQQIQQSVTVAEGKAYGFSAYVGAHRASGSVMIEWMNAAGGSLGFTPMTAASKGIMVQSTGGGTLGDYKRMYTSGTAPAGAVSARAIVRKENAEAGYGDSWIFATRAQFEEVRDGAAAPSDWKAVASQVSDYRITRLDYDAAGRLAQRTEAAGTALASTTNYATTPSATPSRRPPTPRARGSRATSTTRTAASASASTRSAPWSSGNTTRAATWSSWSPTPTAWAACSPPA